MKEKYTWDVTAWKTTPDTQLKFVYDDFEQIEELDGKNSDNVDKKRVWGLKKILCDVHGSTAYYALGDANKNITEYLDSSGTVQAHYEYSPFGKQYASSGSKKDDFDFRFSSEVYDDETGLVYYNYRYYSPSLGRWLSRDPEEEMESVNLFNFVNNNPINWWDYLGLSEGSKAAAKNALNAATNLPGKAGELFKVLNTIWDGADHACVGTDKDEYSDVENALNRLIAKPDPLNLQDFVDEFTQVCCPSGHQRQEIAKFMSAYEDDIIGGIVDGKRLAKMRREKAQKPPKPEKKVTKRRRKRKRKKEGRLRDDVYGHGEWVSESEWLARRKRHIAKTMQEVRPGIWD